MGMIRLPELSDYWCRWSFMQTTLFGKVFTRDRFFEILRFLHLADNDKTPKRTDPKYKLHKLGGIDTLLDASFKMHTLQNKNW